MENGRAGQPADDREVGVEADDHAVRLQPDRPAAAHLRADRRRRARALPRPALLAHRVQRALARVAGRRAWTSAGSPASARTPTGGSGNWDDTRPDDDQPGMAQLFRLNEKWPYPLMPSEYVQRQFHVSFQDDPVAVACRHITGLSTIVWGNDYPHAEGHVPRQPGAASRSSSAASPTTSARRWSAARSAGCSASTRRSPRADAGSASRSRG